MMWFLVASLPWWSPVPTEGHVECVELQKHMTVLLKKLDPSVDPKFTCILKGKSFGTI